jgi:hypothetical protein
MPQGQKPADHPDFFRFPAPAGRSRESSIVLNRQGQFWHDSAPVEHAGMAQAFASWIGRHPDNGRYILSNGYDWTYFHVEDVPFFVRGLKPTPAGPVLQLSDGAEEPLAAPTLESDASGALYCRVRQGQYEAKFTPGAQTLLAPWLVESESGDIELEIVDQRYSVGSRGSAPKLVPA